MSAHDYIRDGAEIYKNSFAIIRREAELARFTPEEERVAVRIIHSCGMVEIAPELYFSHQAAQAGIAALEQGAPIFCDANMVAHGVTRARLPAQNEVICTLTDPRVAGLAKELGTTRTAAAMELWRDKMAGAVLAFGNAPTALFHLFEMLEAGAPAPALVVAMPVGFVGAAESKEAAILSEKFPVIAMRGRKGGSAMAAGALNALASAKE